MTLADCPHPVTENINYLLVNKFNPNEVCTEMTRNSRSSISLLFPPYQVCLTKLVSSGCIIFYCMHKIDNIT